MVSFSGKWNVLKKGDALSQKFMGTVKPEAPLKNRLDVAQKKTPASNYQVRRY